MKAWGDVAFERTMCSAVRRRMLEKGTIWSPAARNEAMETGGACGVRAMGDAGDAGDAWTGGAADGDGAAGAGGGVAVRRASTARWASSRVMRPPEPVPVTSDSLIPFSANSLRTMGDNRPGPSPLLTTGCSAGTGAGAGAGAGAGVGAGAGAGAAGG